MCPEIHIGDILLSWEGKKILMPEMVEYLADLSSVGSTIHLTLERIGGTDIPVHALATAGGTRTLRGYPQDRFLDKTAAVLNAEVSFPIYWRFGGVVGMDAGKVSSSPSGLNFRKGFYLNFGHLF